MESYGVLPMNFLDAAYSILKQSDTPLHFLEITRRAVQANILDTKGQTPGATMGSRLYVDTKKPHSRFKRVQRNLFTLADQQSNKISQHIDMLNQQTRHKLFERLRTMPPDRFEALVGELLDVYKRQSPWSGPAGSGRFCGFWCERRFVHLEHQYSRLPLMGTVSLLSQHQATGYAVYSLVGKEC